MSHDLQSGLDALTAWRRALDRSLLQCEATLAEHDLADGEARPVLDALRQRLAADRLVVAFVAEFSRGKTELINALFFADSGRRVLPAAPGRTTMCPVELAWDDGQPPALSLLPIDTRGSGQTVAALRERPEAWRRMPLPEDDGDAMAEVLLEVTRTRRVVVEEARALGFWNDERPADNPPLDDAGLVEVPAWRHALINHPHPMLRRGLVVVDTPGLNAIGAEPELTLGLLPTAHATVFVLAADTGVTRSDLAVWREHLADRAAEHFVVLNKIDTLADPLLSPEEVEAQIEAQCADVARLLGVARERVYPLSARQGLTARIHHDVDELAASRLPTLEHALQMQLMPQRSQVLGRSVDEGLGQLAQRLAERLAERGRRLDEQLQELQGLRGKSAGRLALMGSRLEAEAADFERCVPRLGALRSVLGKQLATLLDGLGSDRVRGAVTRLRDEAGGGLLKLGASRAFAALVREMRGALLEADGRAGEIEAMLATSGQQLNAEFGFTLQPPPRPRLAEAGRELDRIEAGYGRYLGVTQLWRFAQPGFLEQFSRTLYAKLRMVFEQTAAELEQWAKAATHQIDEQLRERRRGLAQRREAVERIRGAEGELERSIADLEAQLQQARRVADRVAAQFDAARQLAREAPEVPLDIDLGIAATPRLRLVQPTSAAA